MSEQTEVLETKTEVTKETRKREKPCLENSKLS